MNLDLAGSSSLLRLLSDPTRVRLMALLEQEELTVAELADITQLAQPRVSTHLAKLRDAGLVRDRRSGVSSYYCAATAISDQVLALWRTVAQTLEDPLLQNDLERLPRVLAARAAAQNWADSVAGDMERHYSPGRTWEATARALASLVTAGDVLDIASGDGVMAELLAPNVDSVTCMDVSKQVVSACAKRLKRFGNAQARLGDMHALPFPDAHFDLVLILHALTYTDKPDVVISQAARVLKDGGQLLCVTLKKHNHQAAVAPFDHRNMGFDLRTLKSLCRRAGMHPQISAITSQEKRPPHFEVITFTATKQKGA